MVTTLSHSIFLSIKNILNLYQTSRIIYPIRVFYKCYLKKYYYCNLSCCIYYFSSYNCRAFMVRNTFGCDYIQKGLILFVINPLNRAFFNTYLFAIFYFKIIQILCKLIDKKIYIYKCIYYSLN